MRRFGGGGECLETLATPSYSKNPRVKRAYTYAGVEGGKTYWFFLLFFLGVAHKL